MSKPSNPKKRAPIRDCLDEIHDNVKNDAMRITRSRSRTVERDEMPEENLIDIDDDDDELLDSSSNDISPKNKSSNRFQERRRKLSKSDEQIQEQCTSESVNTKSKQNKPKANNKSQEKNQNQSSIKKWCIIVFPIVFFALISICIAKYYPNKNLTIFEKNKNPGIEEPISVMENVKISLKDIRSRYKNQAKDLWKEAFVSIRNVVHNPETPSIILLLGNQSDPIDCLAVLLGNISSNALHSKRLLLTPEKFKPDMGSVIELVRSSVEDSKTIIIWDLLNINTEALKAFHNLCDRINPLVKEVIFIITIIADDYDKEEPLEFVEKELHKKLSGKMKEDAIQPLITRITDGPILTISPEPTVIDCPLPKVK